LSGLVMCLEERLISYESRKVSVFQFVDVEQVVFIGPTTRRH